jgi:hypothetical protein
MLHCRLGLSVPTLENAALKVLTSLVGDVHYSLLFAFSLNLFPLKENDAK